METILKTLKEISNIISQNELNALLNNFYCKDKDVEAFLKTKALEFDLRNKSRTYLILEKGSFIKGTVKILAYFTLSLKILEFEPCTSKSLIKSIDGFSKNISSIAVILIGQFGKDEFLAKNINGDIFLNICLGIIGNVQNLIGGRIALVECLPIEKIVSFYSKNGFKLLQSDKNDKYMQMVMFVCPQ
jgi:hypothetical protein